jgi:hypothetical protein
VELAIDYAVKASEVEAVASHFGVLPEVDAFASPPQQHKVWSACRASGSPDGEAGPSPRIGRRSSCGSIPPSDALRLSSAPEARPGRGTWHLCASCSGPQGSSGRMPEASVLG